MPPLSAINAEWRPSDAVYQLLAQHNIPRSFAEEQLPEFILYWQERGQLNHSWGSKFAKHVVHEWRVHEIKQVKQLAVKPLTAMSYEWRPSKKAIDFLLSCGIAKPFIDECIVSFVMYWQERGELGNVWNSKFVQHCKFRDQQAHMVPVLSQSTRERSMIEDLTDRSWAD